MQVRLQCIKWYLSWPTSIFTSFSPFPINSISLDPEEDETDSTVHDGLRDFIAELSDDERDKFLSVVKIICRFAKNLKNHRPPRGMNFSLQQNSDVYELDVKFVAS